MEAGTREEVRGAAHAPIPIGHAADIRLQREAQAAAAARPLATRAAKRAFDVVFSFSALVVLSPFMAAIAVAIKLDSPGPVLFKQHRVGRFGRMFPMLKFRTMFDGADDHKHTLAHLNEREGGLFKISGDPRVTRIGSFLRSTSLDELPQLFQVLIGEMSIVGPRPLIPEEDRLISAAGRDRQSVRPGLTGPWQVGGPAAVPLSEMAELDSEYASSHTVGGDVVLILKTVPLVFHRRGV